MCDVTFVTINYNGYADTCQLIDSIQANVHSVSYEVIVVDNASRHDEAARLQEAYPSVTVIASEVNRGFAGGNNLALSNAKGRYLMFINNDTLIPDDTLHHLCRRLQSSPRVGLVSPKIKYSWAPDIIQYAGFTSLTSLTLRNKGIGDGEPDHGQHDAARPTAYAHGAAVMTRRETLDAVGPMAEDYFLYYEELDWCERFRRMGYEIWYEPACTILHKESRSVGADSPLKAYYMSRNRLLFASRHRRGMQRIGSLLYLTGVSLLHALASPRRDMARATLRGILHFYKPPHV